MTLHEMSSLGLEKLLTRSPCCIFFMGILERALDRHDIPVAVVSARSAGVIVSFQSNFFSWTSLCMWGLRYLIHSRCIHTHWSLHAWAPRFLFCFVLGTSCREEKCLLEKLAEYRNIVLKPTWLCSSGCLLQFDMTKSSQSPAWGGEICRLRVVVS